MREIKGKFRPVLVNDILTFEEMLPDLRGGVSFDIETTGLYAWHGRIVSLGLGTANAQYIIPWDHPDAKLRPADIVEALDPIIQDCSLITQFGKFDALWMRVKHGVDWISDFDTGLAHYLVDENSPHDLEYLAHYYLDADPWDVPLDVKQGHHGIAAQIEYLAKDLYYTRALRYEIKFEPGVERVFRHIMMPCLKLFTEVEFNGVYIDKAKFDEAEQYLTGEIARTLTELKKYQPPDTIIKRTKKDKIIPFNWGSTQQVGKLLFEDLKIPVVELTPKGQPSTSESVLKRIDHPLVHSLLQFRGAKQQMSFFIEGWRPYLVGDYLHPSFKLHGTVTGRPSSEHPNLQQTPRDARIRQLVSAGGDEVLIEADLSQIELRVAAELSGERQMMYAFTHNIDIHWLTTMRELSRSMGKSDEIIGTAQLLCGKKLSYRDAMEVLLDQGPEAAADANPAWKELRKKAKAVNFGYLYGMWWKKFIIYARDNYDVIVSEKDAQASREGFFELYPDLVPWHRRQQRIAKRQGYVKTLTGRIRHLPDALGRSDDPYTKEALRQAINSPVQGFAAELNLMAALQLREEYPRRIVKICGTIHDSILARVKRTHVVGVANRLLEIMRRPKLFDVFGIEFSVPIEADVKIGAWGKGVSLEKWVNANKPK